MMKKCLHLLISDVRASKVYEGVINFKPRGDIKSRKETSIEFKKLSIFLNLWASIDTFNESILPEVQIPYIWESVFEISNEKNPNNFIDWIRTIDHWSSNAQSEYIVRFRKKNVSSQHKDFIEFVLIEILVHSKLILKEFEYYIEKGLSTIYSEMKIDILRACNNIRDVLDLKLSGYSNLTINQIKKFEKIQKEFLSIIIDQTNYGPNIYRSYFEKIDFQEPKGYYMNDFIKLLSIWRNQYLECRIWLSEEIGFRLNQKTHKDRLFELYCFIEFSEAFKRARLGSTIQRSFISRNRNVPEFQMGNDHFVYFDNRKNNFQNIEKNDLDPNGSNNSIPALKSTYVEWFIQNLPKYENSIVIDTKNGRWVSREALKVIGYMTSYGVNNAIIIFKYNVNHQKIGGTLIMPGLIRVNMPRGQNKSLWVVKIVPHHKYEKENQNIIDCLLKHLFSSVIFN